MKSDRRIAGLRFEEARGLQTMPESSNGEDTPVIAVKRNT